MGAAGRAGGRASRESENEGREKAGKEDPVNDTEDGRLAERGGSLVPAAGITEPCCCCCCCCWAGWLWEAFFTLETKVRKSVASDFTRPSQNILQNRWGKVVRS